MEKIPLPDFEDMDKLATEIGKLSTEALIVKAQIKELEADVFTTVTKEEKYWIKDRPPTSVYIENTYKILGYNQFSKADMAKYRTRYAEIAGELDAKKRLFDLYMKAIEVWRTQSANERGTFY